jgi:uncharacterized membrane protein
MRGKKLMKIKLGWSSLLVGIVLLLTGIFLGFVGADVLNIPFVRMDLVPWAIGLCGTLLLVLGVSSIAEEKYKTKEQHIEENDERIITIYRRSKSKAFDLISILFPFSLLVLAMFGYMNVVAFFLLAGIYFVCMGYFAYHLYKNKAEI